MQLAQWEERLAAEDAVEVIVLTGAGRAFSAGVDLKALGQRRLDGGKVGDVLEIEITGIGLLRNKVAAAAPPA